MNRSIPALRTAGALPLPFAGLGPHYRTPERPISLAVPLCGFRIWSHFVYIASHSGTSVRHIRPYERGLVVNELQSAATAPLLTVQRYPSPHESMCDLAGWLGPESGGLGPVSHPPATLSDLSGPVRMGDQPEVSARPRG
jgi:hypothetical protein